VHRGTNLEVEMVARAIQDGADLAALPGRPKVIGGRAAPAYGRALRGLPMIGSECGGAIPETVPHRNRRLERWSGR